MKLEYCLVDPTRNTTVLVEGTVPESAQPEVAKKLMEREQVAEQVGFVSLNPRENNVDISLRMAGGEFCGNATMSAAVLFCEKARLPRGEVCDVTVRVSGTAKPVHVSVDINESGKYNATVAMPAPKSIEYRDFVYGQSTYHMPIVHFEGISHIIAEELHDRDIAEAAVRQWCSELKLSGLGIMLFDEENLRLDPLVYVPAADTIFWESSCASGTTAVGAYLMKKRGEKIFFKLREPGGELGIEADTTGKLLLSGHVRILKKSITANI